MVRLILLLISLGCCAFADAGFQSELDIAYGEHSRQAYDLHIPDNPNGHVYLVVHGGGWTKGDKSYGDIWPDKIAHWGPKGITVAATNYRFIPEVTPLQQAEDVGLAVKHILEDDRFDRLTLIGHSAGAHLALLMHADANLQLRLGLPKWHATVALDTSAIDVSAIMESGPWHGWYYVFGRDPSLWSDYSPIDALDSSGPPILLICSTLREAPCPQNEAFKQFAQKFGQTVTVIASEKDHLPINSDIGVDVEYTSAIDAWIESVSILEQ